MNYIVKIVKKDAITNYSQNLDFVATLICVIIVQIPFGENYASKDIFR